MRVKGNGPPTTSPVFINYRSTAAGWAVHLDNVLSGEYGDHQVFRASRSIRPAEDFAVRILSTVRGARVLVAVIGPGWSVASTPEQGSELRGEQDWVRREIAEAFANDVAVLPVLVDDAKRLTAEQLPDDIARLARCQYLRLAYRTAPADTRRISDEIARLVPDLVRTGHRARMRRWLPGWSRRRTGIVVAPLVVVAVGGLGLALLPSAPAGEASRPAVLPGARTPMDRTTASPTSAAASVGPSAITAAPSRQTGSPSPQASTVARKKTTAISNAAPWASGSGPFDPAQDCGAWAAALDDVRRGGLQERGCASRVGQTETVGVVVRSIDGRVHRVALDTGVYTCVDGPTACDRLGLSGTSFLPGVPVTGTVPAGSTWAYVGQRSGVEDGTHRCIAVRVSLDGAGAFAGSPFRLDWNGVKNDADLRHTSPTNRCPDPAGWPDL